MKKTELLMLALLNYSLKIQADIIHGGKYYGNDKAYNDLLKSDLEVIRSFINDKELFKYIETNKDAES